MNKTLIALYALMAFAILTAIAGFISEPETIVPSIHILLFTSIGFSFGKMCGRS